MGFCNRYVDSFQTRNDCMHLLSNMKNKVIVKYTSMSYTYTWNTSKKVLLEDKQFQCIQFSTAFFFHSKEWQHTCFYTHWFCITKKDTNTNKILLVSCNKALSILRTRSGTCVYSNCERGSREKLNTRNNFFYNRAAVHFLVT